MNKRDMKTIERILDKQCCHCSCPFNSICYIPGVNEQGIYTCICDVLAEKLDEMEK